MLKAPGSKEASANVSVGDDADAEKQREPDEGGNDCSEPHSVMQFEGQQTLDQGDQDQVNIAVTKQEAVGDEPGEDEGDGSYYEE